MAATPLELAEAGVVAKAAAAAPLELVPGVLVPVAATPLELAQAGDLLHPWN